MRMLKITGHILVCFTLLVSFSLKPHYLDENTIFVVGSTSLAKFIDITKPAFNSTHNNNILVRPIGSNKGIVSIAEGVSDLGIISRFLTAEEQKKWPNLKQITIGQDLIVFLVNRNNPINQLTKKEIKQIYTGEKGYWQLSDGTTKIYNGLLNKNYPFKRPLNILINEQHSQATQNYIDFLLSDQGQKLLSENYFIPLI